MLGWARKKPLYDYKQKNRMQRPRFCRICGKQVSGGNICQGCKDFIKAKKKEEQRKKNTQSKP